MGHSQLWQSDNGKYLTSAPTQSSAQNNVSFKSRSKPELSSGRFLNCVRRIVGSGLVAARARFRGKSRLRKEAG